MRNHKLLSFLSLSLCLVIIFTMLTGCGRTAKQSNSNNEIAETASKTFVMATGHEVNTLYPLNMDPQNNITTKLCYDTLVNYVDGEVVPNLAESWEFNEDGTDLVFHLKQGVTYHDGTPFNAEAVKKVFEFAKPNPNFGGIKAVANLESVEVLDNYTVVFHYPTPYFAYLTDFCYPEVMTLVSPAVLEEGNYQTMKGVVGTGAYIYKEIKDGEYVRFVKNPEYWGDAPYYDEVIVKYIPESSSRLQALKNGEIDMIYGNVLLSWDDYEQALMLPNVEGIISEIDSETRNLVLNASRGALTDLKVREALVYAIDKQAIADGLTYGHETAANALFPSGIPYTDVKLNTVRSFNQEKARSLLEEAGWKLNATSGIREKGGQPLSVTFTYDSGEVMNKPLATMIKSQLAEVGIAVETVGQEMYTWWKEGVAGNYDITIWNTEQPYTSPHNFFTPMPSSSPHMVSLDVIQEGEKFKDTIAEFQTTDDPKRVEEIFTFLLQTSNDQVLNVPITYIKDMIVFNRENISGYNFTSTPMFFDITQVQRN